MKLIEIFTAAEMIEILADAANIDHHLNAVARHILITGTPIPLRINLGFWEEMRLDQRKMILNAQSGN